MHRSALQVGVFVCATLALSCARAPIRVTVDAISSPDAATKRTYVIFPGHEGISQDDLQFREFASYVAQILEDDGITRAACPEDAEVAVFLSYAVSGPQEHVATSSVPVFGQTGTSSVGVIGRNVVGVSRPTYGTTGYRSTVRTYTTYTCTLVLDAYDWQEYCAQRRLKQLWRTSAMSTGSSGDLRWLLPYLVTAAGPHIGSDTGKGAVIVDLRLDDATVARLRNAGAGPEEK